MYAFNLIVKRIISVQRRQVDRLKIGVVFLCHLF